VKGHLKLKLTHGVYLARVNAPGVCWTWGIHASGSNSIGGALTGSGETAWRVREAA